MLAVLRNYSVSFARLSSKDGTFMKFNLSEFCFNDNITISE